MRPIRAAQGRERRWEADFDAAFPSLHSKAYRVAFQLLGSQVDAEDVAQEALIRAYVRWAGFDVRGPDAWVSVVAANLAIDARRRGFRRRREEPSEKVGADGAAQAVERVALRAALSALSRRQREVVVLRYLADMSEADVAAALGVSVNSVKTHAARGSVRLRADLAREPSTEVADVSAPR